MRRRELHRPKSRCWLSLRMKWLQARQPRPTDVTRLAGLPWAVGRLATPPLGDGVDVDVGGRGWGQVSLRAQIPCTEHMLFQIPQLFGHL